MSGERSSVSISPAYARVCSALHCGMTPACTSSQPQAWAAMRRWRSQSSRASRRGSARMASSVSPLPCWRTPWATASRCRSWLPSRHWAASPSATRRLQHRQRLRAAVDQVAQQVDAVARGREVDGGEELVQRVAAALEVAYQIIHAPILLRSRALALPRPRRSPPGRPGASRVPPLRDEPTRTACAPRWTSPFSFS